MKDNDRDNQNEDDGSSSSSSANRNYGGTTASSLVASTLKKINVMSSIGKGKKKKRVYQATGEEVASFWKLQKQSIGTALCTDKDHVKNSG